MGPDEKLEEPEDQAEWEKLEAERKAEMHRRFRESERAADVLPVTRLDEDWQARVRSWGLEPLTDDGVYCRSVVWADGHACGRCKRCGTSPYRPSAGAGVEAYLELIQAGLVTFAKRRPQAGPNLESMTEDQRQSVEKIRDDWDDWKREQAALAQDSFAELKDGTRGGKRETTLSVHLVGATDEQRDAVRDSFQVLAEIARELCDQSRREP